MGHGVHRIGQRVGQVVERKVAAVFAEVRNLAVRAFEHLALRGVDADVGHLLAGESLRLEEEVGHHHVAVVVGVHAVAAGERERRIDGLLLPADFDQRSVVVDELPAVGVGRRLLELHDALHDGVLAAQGRVALDTGRLVVGRAADHHHAHAVEPFEALLHLLVVLEALLVAGLAECLGIVAVVLHVARVVHAEGHGQHRRALAEHVAVEAFEHAAGRLAADARVVHAEVHLREAGHVVEPDVGVVVAAVGDAVAQVHHAVAVLERRDRLRRGGRARQQGGRQNPCDFFHIRFLFSGFVVIRRRGEARSAPSVRRVSPTS